MDFHGNINLNDNELRQAVMGGEANFPTDPKPGRWFYKTDEKVLYFCAHYTGNDLVNGLPVWVPITQIKQMIEHKQPVSALEWSIPHDLNTNAVFVQVYDLDGKWILPDSVITEFNEVTVVFGQATAGFAVVQRGLTEGSTPPLVAFEDDFTNSDTWIVNHALGRNPIIRVLIDGDEVQPLNIVYDTLNTATVTFSSPRTGSVRCI